MGAYEVDLAAPQITGVVLNNRSGRTVSGIDPSGLGVRTIEVRFSEAVTFAAGAVVLEKVAFVNGVEQSAGFLLPENVTGSGTNRMTVTLPANTAIDTWLKVRLGDGTSHDLSGNALDGEVRADGSGRGYIYSAAIDLPTGDGTAGGDAVFYVGSLRGDFNGDGYVTVDDKAGFLAAWNARSLDADFRGVGFGVRPPDGRTTLGDIDGFTSVYLGAVAAGRHLDPLPLLLQAASGSGAAGVDVLAMAEALAAPVADNRTVAANLAVALLRQGGVTSLGTAWAVGASGAQAASAEMASTLDVRQPQEAETAFKKSGKHTPKVPDLLMSALELR